jgi:hypothetical protein
MRRIYYNKNGRSVDRAGEHMRSYIHKEIDKEIKTISGYFMYHEEKRLNLRGRDVLFAVGVGIIDNACCGIGGCRFIEVPGYIVSWKSEVDNHGNSMSKVDPIKDEEEKKEIRSLLEKFYSHSQINFG